MAEWDRWVLKEALLRTERKQWKIAQELGIRSDRLSKLVTGCANPTAEEISKLSDKLRKSAQELFPDMFTVAGDLDYSRLHRGRWTPPEEHTVYLVAGNPGTVAEFHNGVIHPYTFSTEAEVAAFQRGVEAAEGWMSVATFDNLGDAQIYINSAIPRNWYSEQKQEKK